MAFCKQLKLHHLESQQTLNNAVRNEDQLIRILARILDLPNMSMEAGHAFMKNYFERLVISLHNIFLKLLHIVRTVTKTSIHLSDLILSSTTT